MHTFYCVDFETQHLNKEESHHCCKVLRLNEGQEIRIINGIGEIGTGIITAADSKKTQFKIDELKHYPEPVRSCAIAIAPTKSNDRFEFFLEKAVELGVSKIIPILCHRSERKNLNHERMMKIVMSATKQSLRAYLPELKPLTKFNGLEQEVKNSTSFIAHCEEGEKTELDEVSASNTLILIGPEGDFTDKEIALANNWGAKPLSLGINRLRTETAGIFAAAAICKNQVQ